MKKLTYFLATAALLAACSGGNNGYVINGSVEDAADGDMVYLGRIDKRQIIHVDSAVVSNGTFVFKGQQDSVANYYLTWNDESMGLDFFLENGTITVNLSEENGSATGTPNNDIYQDIRTQVNSIMAQANEMYEGMMADSTLTDEQRGAKMAEIESLYDKVTDVNKDAIAKNITNPVGIHLLKRNFYYMGVEELDPLMPQIPAAYANDADIVRIKENVTKMKATAVGQKFTDFEMQTPEGKTVKLSDYVGRGKVVLIDFWASWCGPCRREMPNLVEAYKKYKGKNFEIVGVSLDQSADAWKAAIKQLGITWPQMSDLKYWQCEGAQLYAVSSIPHTVLVDGEGTIIARGLHGDGLQEKLAEVLK